MKDSYRALSFTRNTYRDWETPKTPFCLAPENPEQNVSPLSAKDLATAESMVALWKSEIVDKKLDHA